MPFPSGHKLVRQAKRKKKEQRGERKSVWCSLNCVLCALESSPSGVLPEWTTEGVEVSACSHFSHFHLCPQCDFRRTCVARFEYIRCDDHSNQSPAALSLFNSNFTSRRPSHDRLEWSSRHASRTKLDKEEAGKCQLARAAFSPSTPLKAARDAP